MTNMHKKLVTKILLAVSAACAVISLGFLYSYLNSSPKTSKETYSINILTYKDIPLSTLDGFHNKYPDYKINIERYSKNGYLSFLDARLNQDDSADIIEIPAEAYSKYIYNNTLLPITDMDAFTRIDERALDYLKEISRSDKYFGIPYQSNYLGVWYNVSLFEKYKLEPPDTLQRFMKACRVFKENGIVPLSAGLADSASANDLMTLLTADAFSGAGSPVTASSGFRGLEDPVHLDALRICYDMRTEGYLSDTGLRLTGEQAFQAFLDSTYAMTVAPETYISMVNDSVLQQIDIDVCGFYPAAGSSQSFVIGNPVDSVIGICKESANIDICRTFLDYYTRYETVFQYIEDTRTMTNIQNYSVNETLTASWKKIKSQNCYIPAEHFYLSPYTGGRELHSLPQELFYHLITPEEFTQKALDLSH